MRLQIFGLMLFSAIMLTVVDKAVFERFKLAACGGAYDFESFQKVVKEFGDNVCYSKSIDICLKLIKNLSKQYNSSSDTSCLDKFIGKKFKGKENCLKPGTHSLKNVIKFPLYCCAIKLVPKKRKDADRFLGSIEELCKYKGLLG